MKSTLSKTLAVFTVVTVVFFTHKLIQNYLGQRAINNIQFPIHDLSEAKQLAYEQGKLVIADYSAVWCPSCRKLSQNVFANDTVAKAIDKSFIYSRVDADTTEGQKFASRYKLVGFPRVLVLNPNGDKLVELPLTFNPIEYEFNLKKVENAFSKGLITD